MATAATAPATNSYPVAVTFGVQAAVLTAISDAQTTTVDALTQAQVTVPKGTTYPFDLLPGGINQPTLIIIRLVKAGVTPVQADTLSATDVITYSFNPPPPTTPPTTPPAVAIPPQSIQLLGTQVYANGMASLIQSVMPVAATGSGSPSV